MEARPVEMEWQVSRCRAWFMARVSPPPPFKQDALLASVEANRETVPSSAASAAPLASFTRGLSVDRATRQCQTLVGSGDILRVKWLIHL